MPCSTAWHYLVAIMLNVSTSLFCSKFCFQNSSTNSENNAHIIPMQVLNDNINRWVCATVTLLLMDK